LLWLVVIALFGSFISLYYYLIVLKAIFVDAPSVERAAQVHSASSDLLQQGTIGLLAAAVLLLGVTPQILTARIVAAVW
jgi:NADH:ubiquinone oxidoreductase subunit 2 (subunit N)